MKIIGEASWTGKMGTCITNVCVWEIVTIAQMTSMHIKMYSLRQVGSWISRDHSFLRKTKWTFSVMSLGLKGTFLPLRYGPSLRY